MNVKAVTLFVWGLSLLIGLVVCQEYGERESGNLRVVKTCAGSIVSKTLCSEGVVQIASAKYEISPCNRWKHSDTRTCCPRSYYYCRRIDVRKVNKNYYKLIKSSCNGRNACTNLKAESRFSFYLFCFGIRHSDVLTIYYRCVRATPASTSTTPVYTRMTSSTSTTSRTVASSLTASTSSLAYPSTTVKTTTTSYSISVNPSTTVKTAKSSLAPSPSKFSSGPTTAFPSSKSHSTDGKNASISTTQVHKASTPSNTKTSPAPPTTRSSPTAFLTNPSTSHPLRSTSAKQRSTVLPRTSSATKTRISIRPTVPSTSRGPTPVPPVIGVPVPEKVSWMKTHKFYTLVVPVVLVIATAAAIAALLWCRRLKRPMVEKDERIPAPMDNPVYDLPDKQVMPVQVGCDLKLKS